MTPQSSQVDRAAATPQRWRGPLLVGAFVIYAGLALAGALTGRAVWPVVGLLVLLTALLWPALSEGRRGAWGVWLAVVALLALATAFGMARAAMDALAIPINAAIGWVFARTLRKGHEPLIARMVLQIEGPQRLAAPGVAAYARGLTRVWACVLLGQSVVLLLIWLVLHVDLPIALSPTLAVWLHRYLSYGGYLLMGLLFVLEYPWRRHRLAHLEHMPFVQVTRRVVSNWQALMRDIIQ